MSVNDGLQFMREPSKVVVDEQFKRNAAMLAWLASSENKDDETRYNARYILDSLLYLEHCAMTKVANRRNNGQS